MSDDASQYTCYAPRRRRMSLLQTLRQQNRALADSGFDMHRQRTDSESTNRGRSRKSPSTTNDSGRGSQGHLEEKMEAMVIEEHLENDCGCEEEEEEEIDAPILSSKRSDIRRHRTSSCPDIASLSLNHPTTSSVKSGGKKCPIAVDTESEEDHFERVKRPCSPISAADCLVERRLNRKFIEQRRQQVAM
ncbi:hypothetical protein CAEBREN_08637 [Caenorhabditis brenneri]|uniref:Uncharacterized protein n=1 Tax=Caenorhabditis brenneri TaxID=135651 RepID=G0PML6_CAEBE|nr:hypothetical protein CAEBREN_08637 [Caenorhabditis brenneri]